MKKLKITVITMMLPAVMLTSIAHASEGDLKADLRSVVTAVLAAKEAEDINIYVYQIHPESPLYGTARQRVGNLMKKI